jgi:hypothetical protein
MEKKARGVAMEAHTGTIGIGTEYRAKPRGPRSLAALRERIRQRSEERARRAHALRANGVAASYVPGSEHTHLLRRKGL